MSLAQEVGFNMILLNLIAAAGDPILGVITWPAHQANITDLPSLIMVVINWLLGIAGALAVIAIIYSGFMYITASGDIAKPGGNATQAMKAKKNLVWAIIGVVVILLCFMIVTWVGRLLSTGSTN